ncbi:MAG: dTDP-4-dehydrorhamnose 3,5-epimerase [Psychroflexus salarius]
MTIESTPLNNSYIIKPNVFKDHRGSFIETYKAGMLEQAIGYKINFVQDNQSISKYGAIRGFHFQTGEFAQAKLVRVVKGEVLDVIIDLRPESSTFKQSFSYKLNEDNNHQLFIPRGFAHGFSTLSEEAIFAYKCDNFYNKASERGIAFNDETLNIDWCIANNHQVVSEKDLKNPSLNEYLSYLV